jgi:hypothetical protein
MFSILVNKILVVCPGHLAVVLIGADTKISCHPAALRLAAMPKGFLHNWLDTIKYTKLLWI